jgi:phospholipid/cholesterol/gamma-HCH transport system permease protein
MNGVLTWMGIRFRKSYFGRLLELGFQAVACFLPREGNRRQSLEQWTADVYSIGVESLPLVVLVALVIGSAVILQAATMMPKIGAGDYFGNVMVVVVVREVGPLFIAFLVAGRTGSSQSTYLGNMQAQSEIDALKTMGVDPVRYLVFPSFTATIISMFCLTIVFNVTAILGGFFVVRFLALFVPYFSEARLPLSMFLERIFASMGLLDGVFSIVKPICFGALVSIVASLHGLGVSRDICAVPKATTKGVVNAFAFIVLFDFLFAVPFLVRLEWL